MIGEEGSFSQLTPWTGFRPLTPDDTPIISKITKYPNVFINAGHGSRGMTWSFGSGKILSDLIFKR